MSGELILLVEDNDAVAFGLIYALEDEGYKVIRAANAAEARAERANPQLDLVILDIRLPDGDGFDICRDFRYSGMQQPILMLTARDEVIDKVIGLEVGADDYMTKPFALQELLARIHSLLRRSYGTLASDARKRLIIGDLSLDLDSQRVYQRNVEIHLTNTEFRLLTFLARSPNQVFSRETLLDKVWGYQGSGSDARTVDVHVRNLRQKIEHNPRMPQIILTVRGFGYMCKP